MTCKTERVAGYAIHIRIVLFPRYWMDIDPEYVKAARAKGKMHDREELNMIERQFAYG